MFESLFINDISKLVYKEQNIFGDEKEGRKKETLKEHSNLTLYYLERFSEEKLNG